MSFRQRFLSRIVQPDAFFILLIVGVLGLYTEFTHPGMVAPGVIGGIALVLALYAMHILPVAPAGIVLILLALGLFILEAKYTSHGVLAIGGIVAMLLGALMLVRSPLTHAGVSLGVALGVTLPFALLTIFLMRLVLRSRSWKQSTGREQLVGSPAEVTEPLVQAAGRRNFSGNGAAARRIVARRGARSDSGGRAGARHAHRGADAARRLRPSTARTRERGSDRVRYAWHASGTGLQPVPTRPRRDEMDLRSFSLYGLLIAVFIFLIWFWNSLYVIKEWERGVVLRLGRMQPDAKGAGLRLVFWPIETLYRISLRIETLDVPSQDIITRDNVSVKVNAVAYFRVVDANLALSQVQNYLYATSQKAQTTLRSIVGQFELDEILAEREKVNSKLQVILDQDTEPWGIKVTKVEVKQVDIPEQMQRAIGRQAEAERERRAKVIHAEGEAQASAKLAEAAQVLETQPAAIQLRYLQTLTEIGVEKNTTIVFPLPIDIINEWVKAIGSRKQ